MEKQYLSAEDAYNLIQDGTSVVSALAHTHTQKTIILVMKLIRNVYDQVI